MASPTIPNFGIGWSRSFSADSMVRRSHLGTSKDSTGIPTRNSRCADLSTKYVVAIPAERIDELRSLLSVACFSFQQKCIYLNVAGQVEFIQGSKRCQMDNAIYTDLDGRGYGLATLATDEMDLIRRLHELFDAQSRLVRVSQLLHRGTCQVRR